LFRTHFTRWIDGEQENSRFFLIRNALLEYLRPKSVIVDGDFRMRAFCAGLFSTPVERLPPNVRLSQHILGKQSLKPLFQKTCMLLFINKKRNALTTRVSASESVLKPRSTVSATSLNRSRGWFLALVAA
jgi:hypothetical protein